MKATFPLLLIFLLSVLSTQANADRENDMWQQFKASKGMQELDAQFDPPKPPPEPQPKVVERIIEKVVIKEVPVHVTAPVANSTPIPEFIQRTSAITVENDGYIFNMGPCKIAHKNIKCPLSIQSPESDGTLSLIARAGGYSSKLFDHHGNEYLPVNIKVGNKSSATSVQNRYISGVTIKGQLDFNNVNNATKAIAMLELGLYNKTTKKYKHIQFRDVAMEQ